MKILHTSDWHLGHSLYGYDRTDEQVAMMSQMTQIVAAEQPDVFIISGDVFHTSSPGTDIQRRFAEAILSFHDANKEMKIIITAGNHDSGARLEIFRSLWDVVNVYMIGKLDVACLEKHIFEIDGKGYVIAVPYAYERSMPNGLFIKLQHIVAEKNSEGLPIVMTAHTTVSGCDFMGHDNANDSVVGGIDSLDPSFFGNDYDYLALGHIHKPQCISERIRYSGTPIAVSFDESYSHSVSIVEIGRHGDRPTIRELEVDDKRPLVTLPAWSMEPFEKTLSRLQSFDPEKEAYIRLNVEVDGFLSPNANAEAMAATEGKKCRFCLINAQRKKCETYQQVSEGMTVNELQRIDPMELARRYSEGKGLYFDDELFKEAVRELNNKHED